MKRLIILLGIIIGSALAQVASDNINHNNYTGFEENLGQIVDLENNPVPSVYLRISLSDYAIYLHETGVSFILSNYERDKDLIRFARFDIEPLSAKIEKNKIEFSEPIPGYTNYYLAHCPEGILFVKSFRYLKIKDLYPNIDWVWRCEEKVHNEFVVKPNADLNQIKLKVKWADFAIREGKEVVYTTPLGSIKEGEIYVYEQNGQKVSACFQKDAQGFITFNIKDYDKNKTLIIDPPFERLWATYYGGSDQDNCDGSREIGAITTDNLGNIFITGFTKSTNFPTQNPGGGAYFQGTISSQIDAFICKFNNTGIREWATYYGGSADDVGISLTTDFSNNIFVTGNTFSSTNFPVYNPGGNAYFQSSSGGSGDAFILKFNNAGVRLWATYYGGGLSDVGYGITTDNSGNVFVTGNTYASTSFPTYNPGGNAYYQATNAGSFDAFILKFSNTGVREWATHYGGSDEDHGYAITADSAGNVFVTGMTRSTNFPTYNPGAGAYFQGNIQGYRTVFILKFNNNGVREWATFYGGSTNDYGRSIAVDNAGNVFVVGNTSSGNFPTYDAGGNTYYQSTIGGSDDAFILKFNNAGIRQWATFYGGSAGDIARSIAKSNSGKIFITGNTLSSNFPTYDPGAGAFYQGTLTGGHEVFILGFNNTGVREWATYYGGTGTDYGMSITTDGIGNIFLTGFTLSSNFPTYNPGGNAYYQATNAGSYDAYILKFSAPATDIEYEPNNVKCYSQPIQYHTFFTDRIVLRFNSSYEKEIKVSIYNPLGQCLYSKTISASSQIILNDEQIKNLQSGIYFIRIEVDNKKLGKIKVIKK
ncbi:MAG: SBBP repeat-containing protein [candidate division WOR-3 bacterium]|nr:SBBP repeat-containing protein [candidate division WOR-3 bacterium]